MSHVTTTSTSNILYYKRLNSDCTFVHVPIVTHFRKKNYFNHITLCTMLYTPYGQINMSGSDVDFLLIFFFSNKVIVI